MRRRSRAGDKRTKSRAKSATVTHRNAPNVTRNRGALAQETELVQRTRERDEALERFSATSKVLRVISESAGELQPVFAAMLDNATRICEATSGLLVRVEDGDFRIVASWHRCKSAPTLRT
jgi:hypothetical protein